MIQKPKANSHIIITIRNYLYFFLTDPLIELHLDTACQASTETSLELMVFNIALSSLTLGQVS